VLQVTKIERYCGLYLQPLFWIEFFTSTGVL
jgi:hypothetical protein